MTVIIHSLKHILFAFIPNSVKHRVFQTLPCRHSEIGIEVQKAWDNVNVWTIFQPVLQGQKTWGKVGLHSVINGPLQLFHILQGVVTRHKAQVAIIFLLAKAFQNHFDLIIIGNGGSITWGFVFGLVRRHWEARTTLEKIPFLVEDLWDLWLDEK
jgi:hypothetical protein